MGQKPYPKGFTPDPDPEPEAPPKPSLMDEWNQSWINRPLLSKENTGGVYDPKAAADFYDDPMQRREDEWRIPTEVSLPYGGMRMKVPEWMGAGGSLKALGAGMLEGAGGVVESLTTPLNLATMGAGAVSNRALKTATTLPSIAADAYTIAPRVANVARRATQALSVPVMGQGAQEVYEGSKEGDWNRVGTGVATMAGAGAGMAMPGMPKPSGPLTHIDPYLNRPVPSHESLPVRRPEPPNVPPPVGEVDASGRVVAPRQRRQPARPAGPWNQNTTPGEVAITPDMRKGLIDRGFRDNEINVMTPAQAQEALQLPAPTPITQPARRQSASPDFDPNTLHFVDPNTGELKTAAEAKPGDVAVTPDKTPPEPTTPSPAGRPTRERSLAPPPGLNFADWLKNLAGDERGSFDLDAFRSKETIERNRQAREQEHNQEIQVTASPNASMAPKPEAIVPPREPIPNDPGYTDPDGLSGRMSNQEFAEFQRRQAAWGDPPPTDGDPSRFQPDLRTHMIAQEPVFFNQDEILDAGTQDLERFAENEANDRNLRHFARGVLTERYNWAADNFRGTDENLRARIRAGEPGIENEVRQHLNSDDNWRSRSIINEDDIDDILQHPQFQQKAQLIADTLAHDNSHENQMEIRRGLTSDGYSSTVTHQLFREARRLRHEVEMQNQALQDFTDGAEIEYEPDGFDAAWDRDAEDTTTGVPGEVPDNSPFREQTTAPTPEQINSYGLNTIEFSRAADRIDFYQRTHRPGMANYIFQNTMVPALDRIPANGLQAWIEHYQNNDPRIVEYLRNRQAEAGITPPEARGSTPSSGNTYVDNLVGNFEEAAQLRGRLTPEEIRQQVTDTFRAEMANEGLSTPELDDIIHRAETIARRNLGMAPAMNAEGMPVRRRKTLREVEEGKTQPPMRRLSAMIGREHAEDLASGKVKINSKLQARGMDEPKALDRQEVREWNNDGDSWIRSYVGADPTKPGITIVHDPMDPNTIHGGKLTVHYRDANGLPIGYLSASERGISMLATKSNLGMKRGKVTWDILKEAFERGIHEPDGGTSALTKNFIQRIQYLVEKIQEERAAAGRNPEAGSVNLKEIYDAINDMFKAGKKQLTNFWEDESGSVDPDRLKQLFEQSQTRELTPEELNEARTLARAQPPASQKAREYMTGAPQDSTGPLVEGNQSPRATRMANGGGPQPTGRGPLLGFEDIDQALPVRERNAPEIEEPGMANQIWNAPRSLQSIDLPGLTSAAFRQSRPLAFTTDWFKAWGAGVKAFGSKAALEAINQKIRDSKYMKPQYQAITGEDGTVIRYDEKPSRAEKLGLQLSDILSNREEVIASSLAERIPGYGRYVKASNRAYQGFLNDLRYKKFEQMMDGAEAAGRGTDDVLGKKIADFANRATGRGGLGPLEPIAKELGMALYSPRALAARLQFMNPANYTKMDPLVRKEYWKGLASLGASWAAFSFLASKIPGASVSTDPNNSDFGKVRFGNTRIDPGAGFQQLMVLAARERPKRWGGGGTVSSTQPGQKGKFTEFGSTPMAATRLSLPGRYLYNQLNPSLRFVFDMLQATQKEPFDLTDKSLQLVLPMYAEDIAQAADGDPDIADFFAPLLGSMGVGTNTYDKGNFNKPKITPAIKKATGVQLPTKKLTGF